MSKTTPVTSHIPYEEPIILFDGICHVCTGAVQFVIKRDSRKRFRFASLQSRTADSLLGHQDEKQKRLDSMVLIMNGQTYHRSTAALMTAQQLDGLWPWLGIFLLIPESIRDAIYNGFAKRRYKWFGQHETCWLPRQDIEDRFLT